MTMKSKTWLILLSLTVALLLVFGGQAASGYFSDEENSTDNILRIKLPFLLSANNFAVLAGSTVTNTGATIINGDLGLSPGSVVGGFPPGTMNGTIHIADAAAIQAKIDLTNAYVDAAGQPATPLAVELGGTTQTPGVYSSDTFSITGILTLDAGGDSDAIFIFQAGSTLDTAVSSTVSLINGAKAANVYWQVGSSATLGSNSGFAGNILALTSITLNTGVMLDGRALARTGAVTLDANTITKPTP
jgi:hypothetical protein